MGAARMGSRPLSRLNSPSKRACLDTGLAQRWLGAGLRGSGAWQAPGVEPMRGGVANGQGPDAPGSGASQAVEETPGMIFLQAFESETRVLRRAPWAGHGSGLAPRGNDNGVLSV